MAKAQGGPIKKGQRYEIRGERGCELFIPDSAGTIIRPGSPIVLAGSLNALLDKLKSSEVDEA